MYKYTCIYAYVNGCRNTATVSRMPYTSSCRKSECLFHEIIKFIFLCTNIYVFNKQVCTCTSTHVFTHTLTVAGTQQPFQGCLILAHAERVSVYSMR